MQQLKVSKVTRLRQAFTKETIVQKTRLTLLYCKDHINFIKVLIPQKHSIRHLQNIRTDM
jgi:hypothetical protein